MSAAPSTPEAWAQLTIGQAEVDRLIDGGIVEAGWTPPVSIRDAGPEPIPADLAGHRYRFRLEWHEREGAWYVEGQGPAERGWLIVQGPLWAPSPAERAMDRLGLLLLAACSPEGRA